ncbi:MAG: hypothetical protein IPI50_12590 [Saprospiraceae bacterium]|nr:hypothetical protein [Saprospiraceae bacterium]
MRSIWINLGRLISYTMDYSMCSIRIYFHRIWTVVVYDGMGSIRIDLSKVNSL